MHSPILVTVDTIVIEVKTVEPPAIANIASPMTLSPEIKTTSEIEKQ